MEAASTAASTTAEPRRDAPPWPGAGDLEGRLRRALGTGREDLLADLGRRLEALGVVEVGLQPARRLDAGRARRHQPRRHRHRSAPVGEQRGGYQVGRASGIPAVGGLEQVVGHLQRAGDEGDACPQEWVPPPPAWRMIAAARSPSPARRAFHARVSASAVEAPGDRSGSAPAPGGLTTWRLGSPASHAAAQAAAAGGVATACLGASTSNTPVRWPARSSWKFMCEAEEQQTEQADE